MGDIKDKITIIGRKAIKKVDAIFDSGATYCHVDEAVAKEVGVIMLGRKVQLTTADNRTIDAELGFAVLNIRNCNIPTLLTVKPKGIFPLTIGQNVMQPYGIKLDPQTESYQIKCPIPKA